MVYYKWMYRNVMVNYMGEYGIVQREKKIKF